MAEQMRVEDPELYAQILSEAGPAAEEMTQQDPDAYVALFLAQADDAGHPWLSRRERGLRVAYRVGRWRATADQLRVDDPNLYAQVLSQADGSDEEEAARQDPGAYAALFLSQYADRSAQQLRVEDPDRYAKILSEAKGSDDEEAARRDPDAYVGLFLAQEAEAGIIGSGEVHGS